MAKLFKAPETRLIMQLAASLSLVCGLFAWGCWWLANASGWASLVLWLIASGAVFVVSVIWAKRLLRNLATIAAQLDDDAPTYAPSFNDEGVFSQLHNDIYQFARQNQAAKADLARDRDQLSLAITDIAHQLRTPIQAAENIQTLLSVDNLDQSRVQLQQQNQRLADLVARLITLARIDTHTLAQNRSVHSADDLLKKAVLPLLPLVAEQDLTVDWQVTSDVTLTVNAGQIQEAFVNLLKNTIEHAPQASTIHVALNQTPIETVITFTNAGPAIAENDLPHVFERFYRGEQSPTGNLGIGLAIAQGIINQSAGRLTVVNLDAGVQYRAEFFR